MNHRDTEITEIFTEVLLNLARTSLMECEISEGTMRPFSKTSVPLCALCDSVVN
jgi:hypothetical protein